MPSTRLFPQLLLGLACAIAAGLSSAVDLPTAARADLSLPSPHASTVPPLPAGRVRTAEALAHYARALELESAGRQREALRHYLALLEADPSHPALAMHTAELAYSFQGRKAAVALLEKAIAARPDVPAPYLNLARFCATYAPDDPFENDRAKQALDTALQRFPQSADVYAFAAITHLSRNARDEAVAVMERAATQDVRNAQFWLITGRAAQQVWPLGQAELHEAHTQRVNPFFEKALRHAREPQGESQRLEVAQYYLLTNQLDRARALCERLAAETGNLQARKLLYRLYDAADEKDRALAVLEKIVADAPRDIEQRRLLASIYETREEFAKAVPHLEAALQMGGGEADDYLALGELLLRSQLYEKLVHLTQRSVRLFPDQAMFHVHAALAQRALQKWPEAIRAFEEAATLAENGQADLVNHRFYFQYGVTLERGGRPEDAGRMFEKSIQLTPKDDPEEAANTMNYLGYMWLELDRHLDKAGELILKANELQPNNAAYIDSLGWWHYKKGDYPKALQELQRALDLIPQPEPDDAEIIEHLAQVHLKMNNLPKAREHFERARALQPSDPRVRKRIEEGLLRSSQ